MTGFFFFLIQDPIKIHSELGSFISLVLMEKFSPATPPRFYFYVICHLNLLEEFRPVENVMIWIGLTVSSLDSSQTTDFQILMCSGIIWRAHKHRRRGLPLEFLIPQACVGTQSPAFLASSQALLMLSVRGHTGSHFWCMWCVFISLCPRKSTGQWLVLLLIVPVLLLRLGWGLLDLTRVKGWFSPL